MNPKRLLPLLSALLLVSCQNDPGGAVASIVAPPVEGTYIGFRYPQSTTGGEAGGLFAGAFLLAGTGNFISPTNDDHIPALRVRLDDGGIIEVCDPAMPLLQRGSRVRVFLPGPGQPGRVVPLRK